MSHYSPAAFTGSHRDRVAIKPFPLDIDTPLGLFETDGGNLYLIAKHDGGKVAIVLRHKVERPFLWTQLSRERSANGLWLGRAKVELIGRCERIPGHLPIGSISSDDQRSYLLCRTDTGDCDWISLGQLIGEPWLSFDSWQIVNAGKSQFTWR